MTIELNFEKNYRGLLILVSDSLSGDDLMAMSKEVYALDQRSSLQYQILDLTAIDAVDIDEDLLVRLAELDAKAAERNPGMKIAVVATSEKILNQSRQWAAMSKNDNLSTLVCSDMETARNWLAQFEMETTD